MKLYICSSAENLEAIIRLRDALFLGGHKVLDWTPLLPKPGADFARRKNQDPGGKIFAFCSQACASADMVIYLGPAGQDAGVELGIAKTAGVPVWGVVGRGEAPGLMLGGCVETWFPNASAVVDRLTHWPGW